MPAPVNTVAPALAGTPPDVGGELSCSQGTWDNVPESYTYQWQRAAAGGAAYAAIAGATQAAYVVQATDYAYTLRCVVTATNVDGSVAANSDETIAVPTTTFVPEDGTGLAGANSYMSVAEANLYHALRGYAGWNDLTLARKLIALMAASLYMETRWATKYRGSEQFPDNPQALSFPRLHIGWDGEVPTGIKNACAEYALRAAYAPLLPDPTSSETTAQSVSLRRTKVGPIETEIRYASSVASMATLIKAYPMADLMVRPFLGIGGLVRS